MSKAPDIKGERRPKVGYLPPYSVMKSVIALTKRPDGQPGVEMPLEVFARIFELALKQTGFDEEGYLEKNPDVARALAKGEVASALGHFARAGYFENRAASKPELDAAWYAKRYPDVARFVAEKKISDPAEHWHNNGFYEGRAPNRIVVDEIASWLQVAAN